MKTDSLLLIWVFWVELKLNLNFQVECVLLHHNIVDELIQSIWGDQLKTITSYSKQLIAIMFASSA